MKGSEIVRNRLEKDHKFVATIDSYREMKDKKMKKVSLIIPVYNTEEYLEKCLSSAVNQTYTNLEIICINDGSTDQSGKIVDEFAKRDKRIIAIHQSNHGESYARNQGLKAATGDYIAFMDCDDWIDPRMYEVLVDVLEKNDVDIVASSWYKELDKESQLIKNRFPVVPEKLSRQQLMQYIYRRDDYQGFAYIWNKLYRRELIYSVANNHPILFDENLDLGGDVLYVADILLKVSSAIYIDQAFYHYRQRNISGCHTENIKKRLDWLKAYELVIDKFQRENIDEDILIWVKRFMAYHSSNVAELAYREGDKIALEKCQKIMRKFHKEYFKTNEKYLDRIDRYKKIEMLKII